MITILLLLSTDKCQRDRFAVDPSGFTYQGLYGHNGEFRIDGVYYNYYYSGGHSTVTFEYFFQDGTYFRNTIDANIFNSRLFNCPEILGRDIPWGWGKYMVEGNVVKIQKVNPHASWPGKFRVDESWATIINDSTLHFFKYIARGGKAQPMDVTYHFRQCINKPDSTNVLMRYFNQ